MEKTKINKFGDCEFSQDYLLYKIYENPELDIDGFFVTNADQYINACSATDADVPQVQNLPERSQSLAEFDQQNQQNWYMPGSYKNIDLVDFFQEKLKFIVRGEVEQSPEWVRTLEELAEFERRNMSELLRLMIFLVDTFRENNIVWGVGRGSSVASYCLFLIGVHKIDPIRYNLDWQDFLR